MLVYKKNSPELLLSYCTHLFTPPLSPSRPNLQVMSVMIIVIDEIENVAATAVEMNVIHHVRIIHPLLIMTAASACLTPFLHFY